MKDKDQDLIFEAYAETLNEDNNDQYAPEEAPADDQLGGLEPLDTEGDEAEENASEDIAKALQDIVGELKTLNQYADFMTTGTRAQGFTGGIQKQKEQFNK
jgi:hypothetical protein